MGFWQIPYSSVPGTLGALCLDNDGTWSLWECSSFDICIYTDGEKD